MKRHVVSLKETDVSEVRTVSIIRAIVMAAVLTSEVPFYLTRLHDAMSQRTIMSITHIYLLNKNLC
jgi:hypothetical protein